MRASEEELALEWTWMAHGGKLDENRMRLIRVATRVVIHSFYILDDTQAKMKKRSKLTETSSDTWENAVG